MVKPSGISPASNPGKAPPIPGRAVSLERSGPGTSLIELLERILDKGIVVDAARASQAGTDLMTDDARIAVVAIQERRLGP